MLPSLQIGTRAIMLYELDYGNCWYLTMQLGTVSYGSKRLAEVQVTLFGRTMRNCLPVYQSSYRRVSLSAPLSLLTRSAYYANYGILRRYKKIDTKRLDLR